MPEETVEIGAGEVGSIDLALPSVTSDTEMDPSVYRSQHKGVLVYFTTRLDKDKKAVVDRLIFPDHIDGAYINIVSDYLIKRIKVAEGLALRIIQRAHAERKTRLAVASEAKAAKRAKAKAEKKAAAEKAAREATAKAKGK